MQPHIYKCPLPFPPRSFPTLSATTDEPPAPATLAPHLAPTPPPAITPVSSTLPGPFTPTSSAVEGDSGASQFKSSGSELSGGSEGGARQAVAVGAVGGGGAVAAAPAPVFAGDVGEREREREGVSGRSTQLH